MDIKYESVEASEQNAQDEQEQAVKIPLTRRIAVELMYFAVGAALGMAELPFGARPLGVAALCATGKRSFAVFLGLLLSSAATSAPAVYIAAYVATLLIRLGVCLIRLGGRGEKATVGDFIDRAFEEHLSIRTVTAAFVCFFIGLYNLFGSGFLYYDLFGAIIGIVVSAVATLLWYPIRDMELEGRALLWRRVGTVALCAALVWGLRGIGFYGISLSAFVCMLLTLTVTEKKGVVFGAFCAIFSGLAVSVSLAPLFVFGAICYGVLGKLYSLLGCVACFAAGMAWGIYMDGIAAISALLPALLGATFTFFIVNKLFFKHATKAEAETREQTVSADAPVTSDIAVVRLDDAAGRIKMLCEGFASLSDMLLQTKTEKTYADLSDIESIRKLKNGLSVEIGEMGAGHDDELDFRAAYYNGVTAESMRTEAIALELRAVSDYLAGVMVENQRAYEIDTELSSRVSAELLRILPDYSGKVTVFGESKKRAVAVCDGADELERCRRELESAVGRVCGCPMTSAETWEFEGRAYAVIKQRAILDASFAGRKRNALGETEFCGDSFGIIKEAGDGKSVSFISDGMGSGREAAVSSGLCALFLQKLLPVNLTSPESIGVTLSALNGFLRSRNGSSANECSATVDLAMFDLVECRAHFYKSGAAPTYIFRDGALFKLRSRTVPIGIVKEADVGKMNMELLPGDVVVMVSDGITEGREECPELFEFLRSRLLTHDHEQLADAVMKYADERGCTDDVSVIVAKITEKPLSELVCE